MNVDKTPTGPQFVFRIFSDAMVASAVLGAAAGTGMALFVAMTIVVYRYYTYKRKAKEWGSLDRMPYPEVQQRRTAKPHYAVTQKVKLAGARMLFLLRIRVH